MSYDSTDMKCPAQAKLQRQTADEQGPMAGGIRDWGVLLMRPHCLLG